MASFRTEIVAVKQFSTIVVEEEKTVSKEPSKTFSRHFFARSRFDAKNASKSFSWHLKWGLLA
jgi:hypothetical protein